MNRGHLPARGCSIWLVVDPRILSWGCSGYNGVAHVSDDMTLAQGTRLGPYVIQSPLGAGGMGEVYRARDSRLDRDVAIKVLQPGLAWSSQIRLRFEREAKIISSLSHPNICTLYDVGEAHIEGHSGGSANRGESAGSVTPGTDSSAPVSYLVMELLEGETLASRIARGALPLDQALKIGIEVADALDQAHRHGVVHRDLKPGNIMLTRTGTRLLDFGLARRALVLAGSGSDDATAHLSDEPAPLTEKGAIVGTLQYMAPEQLDGDEADVRSDIFALGVVLYEMVTGRRAFQGATKASLIAAILEREPEPIRGLVSLTPPALEHVILKCLDKDREARWQSCHDIAEQLRWISRTAPEEATKNRPKSRRVVTLAGWGVAALLAVGAATAWYLRPPEALLLPGTPLQFGIPAPENGAFGYGIAVSPDGTNIVFRAAGADGESRLWLRQMDGVESRPLSGTEGALHPFWSPEGGRVGFFAEGKLRRIDLSSGEVRTICDAGPGGGGTWNSDGVIVFVPDWESSLYRVPAAGGKPAELTLDVASREKAIHLWPHFLPDGRRFLFSMIMPEHSGLYAGSLDSNEIKRISAAESPNDISMTAYADGYVFFVRGLALFGQKFEPESLALEGEPIRIADALDVWGPGTTNLSASASGVLAFREEQPRRKVRLTWFSADGERIGAVEPAAAFVELDVSNDERRAVVSMWPGGSLPQIAIVDLARGVTTLLTREHWHGWPFWTPDGKTLLYSAATDGPPNVVAYNEETGETRRVQSSQVQTYVSDVSSDGRQLVLMVRYRETGWDVYTMPIVGGSPVPLLNGPADEQDAHISPDGRRLVWTSNESGREEIYLASYPSLVGKLKVSPAGGSQPQWSPDGSRIYYKEAERLLSVELEAGGRMAVSEPREIFHAAFGRYRVTGSGRILASLFEDKPQARPIRVIVNWKAAMGNS